MSWEWIKKHMVEIILVLVAILVALGLIILLGPSIESPKRIGSFASLCMEWRTKHQCSSKQGVYETIGGMVADEDGNEKSNLQLVCEEMFPMRGSEKYESKIKCQRVCMNFCNPILGGG